MQLLNSIGIKTNVSVSGDTRFDRVIQIAEKPLDIPLVKEFCGNHRVLVAGSTWEDDEVELIHYVKANPDIKFIIAPHEIDKENLLDIKKEFAGSVFYSSLPGKTNAHVLIIDNIGMLSSLYRYATIAYVGGGFGDDGVHNVLEAAVYGKPVFFGPEYEKFYEATGLIDSGGAVSINSAIELEQELNQLFKDPILLNTTGKSAKDYVYANAGATQNIIRYIQLNRLLIR